MENKKQIDLKEFELLLSEALKNNAIIVDQCNFSTIIDVMRIEDKLILTHNNYGITEIYDYDKFFVTEDSLEVNYDNRRFRGCVFAVYKNRVKMDEYLTTINYFSNQK